MVLAARHPQMREKYCMLRAKKKKPPDDELVSLKHDEKNLTGIN